MNFQIYNHSSEKMSEVDDNLIDLIVAGPPYNISTEYNSFKDKKSMNEYIKILKKIFSECFRVLSKEGYLIIESTDSIFSEGTYVQLSGLIQNICLKIGFRLETRHINFIKTKNHVEIPDHEWKKNYTTTKNAHSNCHQYLVFRKKKTSWKKGEIFYENYLSSIEHPCPFSLGIVNFILDKYFKKSYNVLDPFMGTANLGVEVIKRKGKFYGYEIVKEFYETAQSKLERLNCKTGFGEFL